MSGPDLRRERIRAGAVALVFIAAYYVAQAVASFAFTVWILLAGKPEEDILTAGNSRVSVLYGVLLVILYGLYILMRRRKTEFVAFARPRAGQIGAAVLLSMGMLGSANALYLLADWLASKIRIVESALDNYDELVGDAFALDSGIIWTILGICILVPIAEELLFRGIVQNELSAVFSERTAVLAQALLFSLFHLQLVQSVYVFIPGLVMGIVYATTRSLYLPIFMHMLFNFFGSGVFYTLTESAPGIQTAVYLAQYACIFVGIAVLAGLVRHRRLADRARIDSPARS